MTSPEQQKTGPGPAVGKGKSAANHKPAVGLKLNGRDFACTVCGCQKFIKETLVVKTKDSGFFSATPSPLMTCMICTGCGYAHPFMPQYILSEGKSA